MNNTYVSKGSVAIVVVLFSYKNLFASDGDYGFLTRGFFGNVEYGYSQEQTKSESNEEAQSALSQNYTLGKTGFIYSPKLVSYLVQGSLLMSESESTSSQASSESANYRINTDIIRESKYPFTVYADKTTTPYSNIQAGSTLSYNEVNNRYGISGTAKVPYVNFRYSATVSDMQRDESSAYEMRDEKTVMGNVYQNYDHGSFSAIYNANTREYSRDNFVSQIKQGFDDQSNDVRINGTWTPDKTLRFASNASYVENTGTSYNMSNITGNLDVAWMPTDRYIAGLDVSASTMSAAGSKYNTLMLNANSYYKVTPGLSTTQNIALNRSDGDSMKYTMEMATLGVNYHKSFENEWILNTSASVTGQKQQNETSAEVNSTSADAGINKEAYSYSFGQGVSKHFDSIATTFSGDLSYYGMTSSLEEESQRMSANMLLSSNLWMNFYNTFSLYYIKDDSLYYAGGEIGMLKRNTTVRTASNRLNYSRSVGYNGRLALGGGVSYSVSQSNDEESITRIYPHVNGSFSYLFFNALQFTSLASASQDSVSDLTNYSANVGFNYRIRKITMSLDGHHYMQTGVDGRYTVVDSLFFKVARRF